MLVVGGVVALAVVGLVLMRSSRPAPEAPPGGPAPEAAGEPTVLKRETAPPVASPAAPPPRAASRAAASATAAPPEAAPAPEAPVAPVSGTLRIVSDVPGAQVFLDRQFVGTAPVTAENVAPGSHQINVSAEGFDGFAQTIDVTPGPRDITVRFREVRLDARLAVVHKHRIGSCSGQLVASPQGLRYETSDADDRFTVAFGDLETFLVDYQDKNLKLKVRKGRQYNFTDPDGNADRIFVFHRDVDRARQRLAKGDAAAN